jgi:serine/threonine protein kinase
LEGVKFMHSQGVVHRDLKPDNVLLTTNGSIAKIIDFNVARSFPNKEFRMFTRVGLEQWNAPEALTGSSYNEKVDEWGVGCIIYFLITGEEPFQKTHVAKMQQQIRNSEFNIDHQLFKSCSKEMKDLFQKLTMVDPNHRISAAEALEHVWLKHKHVMIKIEKHSSSAQSASQVQEIMP